MILLNRTSSQLLVLVIRALIINLLVLIGPPAVGKTTLANKLGGSLEKSKVFSFDKEFPLGEIIKNKDKKNSKDFRREFLEMICFCLNDSQSQSDSNSIYDSSSSSSWIIVDDTCHLKSMQKRYIQQLPHEVKVIFLYISARNDQIPELKRRNLNRSTSVNCDEIERITKHLNSFDPIKKNLIEFNFEAVPEIGILTETINGAVCNYSDYKSQAIGPLDAFSDSNYFHQLNLALTKEISKAFKIGVSGGGDEVSKQKKQFLLKVRRQSKHQSVEELIEEFRINHLNE